MYMPEKYGNYVVDNGGIPALVQILEYNVGINFPHFTMFYLFDFIDESN